MEGGDKVKRDVYLLLKNAAKKVSEMNVNSACMWFAFQPHIPEQVVDKLKKYGK